MKGIAKRAKEALDKLPPDPAGQVKALEKHEFINPDAQRKFLELLNQLRRAMTQTFFNDIERMVKEMSAGDIERMKDMLKALNDMLVKKIAGEDPGFEEFMDEVRRHVRRRSAAVARRVARTHAPADGGHAIAAVVVESPISARNCSR